MFWYLLQGLLSLVPLERSVLICGLGSLVLPTLLYERNSCASFYISKDDELSFCFWQSCRSDLLWLFISCLFCPGVHHFCEGLKLPFLHCNSMTLSGSWSVFFFYRILNFLLAFFVKISWRQLFSSIGILIWDVLSRRFSGRYSLGNTDSMSGLLLEFECSWVTALVLQFLRRLIPELHNCFLRCLVLLFVSTNFWRSRVVLQVFASDALWLLYREPKITLETWVFLRVCVLLWGWSAHTLFA